MILVSRMDTSGARTGPARGAVRVVAGVTGLLIAIVLGFAVARVVTDWPHILDGTVPDDGYAARFVEHPWRAYLHIVPGVGYLLLAPLQLSRSFRTRHYDVHRRLGRVLLTCGLVSGTFAIAFGVPLAWGGRPESAATAVFGAWFLGCLLTAYRAIRRQEVARHRRWMIRAFAVGVAVGTIRIWVAIFQAFGLLDFPDSLAVAFWVAFPMHVAAGEWWLRRTPDLDG